MRNPDVIYIDAAVQDLPITRNLTRQLSAIPQEVVSDPRLLTPPATLDEGKRQWLCTRAPRGWLTTLAPSERGTIRLGMDLVVNPPYAVSYCPLQVTHAAYGFTQVYCNLADVFAELTRRFARAPHQRFRIQTGRKGDLLALDETVQWTQPLIPFFALMPNATLELKTRTNTVAQLLDLPHHGRTVITFALNPRPLIESEERGTASLMERLIAARRCLDAGYRVAFAIDPIVHCPNWQRLYEELLDELFAHIPPEACEGIALACLSYSPGLPAAALRQFPGSCLFHGEFVPVRGQYRYFRPIREAIYRWFTVALDARQVPLQTLQASA